MNHIPLQQRPKSVKTSLLWQWESPRKRWALVSWLDPSAENITETIKVLKQLASNAVQMSVQLYLGEILDEDAA